jgi:ribosomal protein S20
MPRTTSAQKALRQNVRRRKRALARGAHVKMVVKKFKKLIESHQIKEAEAYLPTLYKTIDKMGKEKFLKSGKANRMKSRFSKKLIKK